MTVRSAPEYSRREELANVLTHLAGVGFSIAALCLLVVYARANGDAYHIVSVSIFGTTLILLYLMSTIYHIVREPSLKHALRIVDHSCIYLLIAGSYTPFMLVNMRGAWGWSLFGVIWGLAVFGIVYKIMFIRYFPIISTLVYVAMGWLLVVGIKPAFETIPAGGLGWLLAGGLLYTGGVTFYVWRKLPFNHAIWHLFVMGGSFCHFLAVFWYVIPVSPS